MIRADPWLRAELKPLQVSEEGKWGITGSIATGVARECQGGFDCRAIHAMTRAQTTPV